jgi:hypothetical protein
MLQSSKLGWVHFKLSLTGYFWLKPLDALLAVRPLKGTAMNSFFYFHCRRFCVCLALENPNIKSWKYERFDSSPLERGCGGDGVVAGVC